MLFRALKFMHPARLLCACLLVAAAPGQAATSSGTIAVSATVISKNQCKFNAKNLVLDLGTIDPSSSSNVSQSVTVTMKCAGSSPVATYAITANDGLYPTGTDARRMRHGTLTTRFLPYSLGITPASATIAKNAEQTITITGTVTPAGFRDAAPGSYSDTVVITLTP